MKIEIEAHTTLSEGYGMTPSMAGERAILVVRNGRLHPELGEYLENGRYATTRVLPLIDREDGTHVYSVTTRGKDYTIDMFVKLVQLLETGELEELDRRADRLGLAEGERKRMGR